MANPASLKKNSLWYGDNLDILRTRIADESVDLVYLDPPFNSNRSFNVLFRHKSGGESAAQIEAFDDTWTWSQESVAVYKELLEQAPPTVAEAIEGMWRLLGENDVLAYLVMMTARLVELRRVLKPTGSLYLHCDPTASHYLKIVLDAVFGLANFRNEIIWKRTGAKGLMTQRLPSNHDVILAYQKTGAATWNADAMFDRYDPLDLDVKTDEKYSHVDAKGRRYQLTSLINPAAVRPNLTYEFLGVNRVWRWTRERMEQAYSEGRVVQTKPGSVPREKRYLDEQRGRPLGDVWSDIAPINARAAERLGYPTQKPVTLLERIISASSRPGDVVLDPFCGCGTTIDAAQRLQRNWIGIDITYLAIDLINTRLRDTFGPAISDGYEILGIPKDVDGARALFASNPFDFERWAVSLVDGTPNERQVGDKGSDGVIRFPLAAKTVGRTIVSVKGGGQLNPAMVRDLIGSISAHRGQMGVLLTLSPPTPGMRDAAAKSGSYLHELTGKSYPLVQILTVGELLAGKTVKMPSPFMPYLTATKYFAPEPTLFDPSRPDDVVPPAA